MESTNSSSFDSFKSKKVLHSISKSLPSDQPTGSSDPNPWSSQTPEKSTGRPRCARTQRTAMSIKEVRQFAKELQKSDRDRPVRSDPIESASQRSKTPAAKSKKVESSIKLPEKYEILSKFFDSLDCSIRLLRLKGMVSTFTNISPKIEYLTDRRFSHSHLAQLKFILPEVIEIDKVRIHNEHTDCKTADLHITLNVDAIGNDGKLNTDSGNLHLRKVFRARLVDFFKSHPKGDEIPEEVLPEPFNQPKPSAPSAHHPPAAAASHLSQSFRRRFSQRASCPEASNTNQEPSTVSFQQPSVPVLGPHLEQSSKEDTTASTAPSPVKFSLSSTGKGKCMESGASLTYQPSCRVPITPIKQIDSTKDGEWSSMGTDTIQCTPAKLASTPAKLMSATPARQPPKRSCMSPNDDSTSSPSKLVRRPPIKILKFDTPVKNAKVDEVDEFSVDNDIFDILPESLLQSIKEKERKSIEDKDPAISQAKWRKQMIASLPRLFDMIRLIFQSINRSLITKEDLIHRIISSHLNIVDRREVEEQLRLLQEFAPKWIYEKLASTGDVLICVNKISCTEAIRATLAEAK